MENMREIPIVNYDEIQTIHYLERQDRIEKVKSLVGLGAPIKCFYWDRGHINGAEEHFITDTGIIIIRNTRTKKLITVLIARPGQIRRYWLSRNMVVPKEMNNLINLARQHQDKGYNLL